MSTVARRRARGRRLAVLALAAVALGLLMLPAAAPAAGSITTSAQGLRASLSILGGTLPVTTTAATWSGGATDTRTDPSAVVTQLSAIASLGAVTSTAGAVTNGPGGTAAARVASLDLLGLSTGAISTGCSISPTGITGSSSIANLKVGATPRGTVTGALAVNLANVLSADLNTEIATWDSGTGLLTYKVRALDVNLLTNASLGTVANSQIVIAESVCSGKVRLGAVKVTPVVLTAGQSGTPTVSVDNLGDAAAPNTVITVPLPPAGYRLGTPTTTGGGTCVTGAGQVTCSHVTVPAGGAATVSLPVTRTSATAPWAPAAGIDAISTPVAAVPGTTIASNGSGTLVTPLGGAAGGLTVTVTGPADGTLDPGDTADLTVTAANTGATALTAVPYAFLAPAGATFVAPVPSYCTLTNSGRVDCTLTVNAAADLRFPLRIKIASSADPTVVLTGGCADAGHDGACTIPPDSAIPDIRLRSPITFSVATATVAPGSSGTGTLKVRSTTAVALSTVSVPLDTLPSGLHVTCATGPGNLLCALTGSAITCANVPLLAGADTAIAVTVAVDAGVAAGTVWHATGIKVLADLQTYTGSADLIRTLSGSGAVKFTVSSPSGTLEPGATTSMTVTGVNTGAATATDGAATIAAPSNATFGALVGAVATACKRVSGTRLSCAYTLAPGASLTWALPLTVAPDADEGDRVADGCVTSLGATTCGGSQLVTRPLAGHGALTVGGAVIEPGNTGTATVTLSATAGYDDLVLTVPLDDLPAGFEIGSATLGADPCTVGTAGVVCTGVSLTAGTARNLRLPVSVGEGVSATTLWRATGITLARATDPADKLTAAGILVSTSATSFTVGVTVGAVSPAAPKPGETTYLPITVTDNGPGDATGYPVTIMLPDGTSHGTLPGTCAEGSTATIVVCRVTLTAGESADIKLPLIIDADLASGSVITGGCVDEPLGTGTPTFDYTCGGRLDVAIPDFTLGKHDVDLAVTYGGGTVPIATGSNPVVKIPYHNDGSGTAVDVVFTVEPPGGVWITRAQVLVDSAATTSGVRRTADRFAAAGTVEATCAAAMIGKENDVTCEAPDAAADSTGQLWLTLKLGDGVTTGTQAMRVTVTTTSADGVSTNNAVDVPLQLTAQSTGGGGGLPVTGPDAVRLAGLSALLVALGVLLIVSVREREVATAGRHSRPVSRWGTATRGRAGSRASAAGSGATSHAARPADPAHRPPARAASGPARRRRCDE